MPCVRVHTLGVSAQLNVRGESFWPRTCLRAHCTLLRLFDSNTDPAEAALGINLSRRAGQRQEARLDVLSAMMSCAVLLGCVTGLGSRAVIESNVATCHSLRNRFCEIDHVQTIMGSDT